MFRVLICLMPRYRLYRYGESEHIKHMVNMIWTYIYDMDLESNKVTLSARLEHFLLIMIRSVCLMDNLPDLLKFHIHRIRCPQNSDSSQIDIHLCVKNFGKRYYSDQNSNDRERTWYWNESVY